MNWKKRYEGINIGDRVKLLFIDKMDRDLGVTDEDVGKIFTIEKIELCETHKNTGYYTKEVRNRGDQYIFYITQIEKVLG